MGSLRDPLVFTQLGLSVTTHFILYLYQYNFEQITLLKKGDISWYIQNSKYLSILFAVLIFPFFGKNKGHLDQKVSTLVPRSVYHGQLP